MIAYFKLLDHLNRLGIGKEEFRKAINIAPSTMAKISKNEPVSLSIIDRICEELDCQPGDILEYYEKAYNNKTKEEVEISVTREPLEVENREIINEKERKNSHNADNADS